MKQDAKFAGLPKLTAVIGKENRWFTAICPELGICSQGRTHMEAYRMLAEATQLWLVCASGAEIKRQFGRRAGCMFGRQSP